MVRGQLGRSSKLLALAAVVFLGGAFAAQAAMITTDGSTTASGTLNTFTFSHTVNAGLDRFLVVGIGAKATGRDITVTWNGTALTQAIEQDNSNTSGSTTWIFYLKNPAVGTFNIVADFDGTATEETGILALNLLNVDSFRKAQGNNAGSLNVTSIEEDDFVFDAVIAHQGSGTGGNLTPGTNQTEFADMRPWDGRVAFSGETSTGSSVDMSWTSSFTVSRWSHAAAAFEAVPEPGTIALAGLGLLGLVPVAARRWRKRG